MLTKTEALHLLKAHITSKQDPDLHPHTLLAELFKEIVFEAYAYDKGDLQNPPILLLYIVSHLSHKKYALKGVDFNAYIKTIPFELDFQSYCEEVKNVNKLRYYSIQVPKEIARHISAQYKPLNYSINPMLLEPVYTYDKVY